MATVKFLYGSRATTDGRGWHYFAQKQQVADLKRYYDEPWAGKAESLTSTAVWPQYKYLCIFTETTKKQWLLKNARKSLY
jgi:hypothetical protein